MLFVEFFLGNFSSLLSYGIMRIEKCILFAGREKFMWTFSGDQESLSGFGEGGYRENGKKS